MRRLPGWSGRILFILGLALLGACSSEPVLGPFAPEKPDWIDAGSRAAKQGDLKAFSGVGMAPRIRKPSIALTMADDRARNEVKRLLEAYAAALRKAYAASAPAGDFLGLDQEQSAGSSLRRFAESAISAVVIIDHWQNRADKTLYTLARLDLAGVQRSIEEFPGFDDSLRAFLRGNAETVFDGLAAGGNPGQP